MRAEEKTQRRKDWNRTELLDAIGNREKVKEASRRDEMREIETMDEMGGREIRKK